MSRALRWGIAAVGLFVIATLAIGWWAILVVALGLGRLAPAAVRPAILLPLSAGVAWALLLAYAATVPRFAALVVRLEGVLGAPVVLLAVVTILFSMLLVWGVVVIIRPHRPRAAPEHPPSLSMI